MSIYHLSIKIISRAGGRSAIASAAYRSGERLYNDETGLVHDFTRKGGVVHSEIMLPENAPDRYLNREVLWNEVQKVESRADAQFAREIEVAFPVEMTREEQLECVRNYIKKNFVNEGMIADFAIHDTGKGNPHAHILLTVRGIDEKSEWMQKQRTVFANSRDSSGRPIYDPNLPSYDAENKEATSKYRIPALDKNGKQKVRVRKGKGTEYLWEKITIPINDWNEHSRAEIWRASWAEECNKYLAEDKHIDHRSYERQGVDVEPMVHEGIISRQMEKNGQIADRCEINRKVRERNRLRESIRKLAREITEIIVEKARDLIDRIRGITGSFKYHRKPGRASRYIGGTGKGDSFSSSRQGATSRRAGRAGEYQQFIDAANQKLSDTDREIAATDKRIDELKSLIKEKEAERNERIRKIMERRRASGYVGTAGESNREIQKSNAELSGYAEEDGDEIRAETERKGLSDTADEVRKLIDNLGAKERASVKKRDDSEAKRENREISNKRPGTSRSESTSTGSRINNEDSGNKAISKDGESRKR